MFQFCRLSKNLILSLHIWCLSPYFVPPNYDPRMHCDLFWERANDILLLAFYTWPPWRQVQTEWPPLNVKCDFFSCNDNATKFDPLCCQHKIEIAQCNVGFSCEQQLVYFQQLAYSEFSIYIVLQEEVTAKGPDASQIDKLTAEAGQVKGNKVPDFGASALHFDVCMAHG